MRSRWMFAIAFFVIGCDGGGTDAGTDTGPPPIALTANSASATDLIDGSFQAPAGFQYYVVDMTIVSNTIGPLGVAPAAFSLFLTDGTRSTAIAITNSIMNGCVSRSVPLGGSASCRLAFQELVGAAPPERLEWSDGMPLHMATTSVPALTP